MTVHGFLLDPTRFLCTRFSSNLTVSMRLTSFSIWQVSWPSIFWQLRSTMWKPTQKHLLLCLTFILHWPTVGITSPLKEDNLCWLAFKELCDMFIESRQWNNVGICTSIYHKSYIIIIYWQVSSPGFLLWIDNRNYT